MGKFIEFLGWYGALAIVLAYGLLSFSFLTSTNIWYQILNGTGALGIFIESYHKKDYQPAVLNTIWIIIAIAAIAKILF